MRAKAVISRDLSQARPVQAHLGHTGQAAATALKLLGYDVINMKFGMMGWSDDPDVVGTTPFTTAPDYPTVTG